MHEDPGLKIPSIPINCLFGQSSSGTAWPISALTPERYLEQFSEVRYASIDCLGFVANPERATS